MKKRYRWVIVAVAGLLLIAASAVCLYAASHNNSSSYYSPILEPGVFTVSFDTVRRSRSDDVEMMYLPAGASLLNGEAPEHVEQTSCWLSMRKCRYSMVSEATAGEIIKNLTHENIAAYIIMYADGSDENNLLSPCEFAVTEQDGVQYLIVEYYNRALEKRLYSAYENDSDPFYAAVAKKAYHRFFYSVYSVSGKIEPLPEEIETGMAELYYNTIRKQQREARRNQS